MTTERLVRIIAGLFVLLSLALGVQGSPLFINANFLWFTVFVGANLFQTRLSGLNNTTHRHETHVKAVVGSICQEPLQNTAVEPNCLNTKFWI